MLVSVGDEHFQTHRLVLPVMAAPFTHPGRLTFLVVQFSCWVCTQDGLTHSHGT